MNVEIAAGPLYDMWNGMRPGEHVFRFAGIGSKMMMESAIVVHHAVLRQDFFLVVGELVASKGLSTLRKKIRQAKERATPKRESSPCHIPSRVCYFTCMSVTP
jgi:hypothetical protein